MRIVKAVFPMDGKTEKILKSPSFFTDFYGKSIFRPRVFAIKTKNNAKIRLFFSRFCIVPPFIALFYTKLCKLPQNAQIIYNLSLIFYL